MRLPGLPGLAALVAASMLATGGPVSVAPLTASSAVSPGSVALSSCTESDHGEPDITSLRLEPAVLDVRTSAQTLRVVATAEDTGGPGPATGITLFRVSLPLFSLSAEGGVDLERAPDGSFVGEVVIPPGVEPGSRRVSGMQLYDAVGNGRLYSSAWLHDNGLDREVTFLSAKDSEPPAVKQLTASRTSVDTRNGPARVRFTARLVDRGAGVSSARVEIGFRFVADLRRVSGTAHDGEWAGAATIPRWQSEALVTHDLAIGVSDLVDNWRSLLRPDLERRDMPATVRVRAAVDTAGPRVDRVRQSAALVDVRERDGQLVARVRARDTGSGVGAVGLGYGDDDFSYYGRLVHGDRHRGTWRVVMPISRCYEPGGTRRRSISIGAWDRLGRLGFAQQRLTWTTTSLDTTPPRRAAFSPLETTPTGPAVLTFGEDVTGIADSTMPVRPFDPEVMPGYDPPAPVSGSWSCLDASSSPVDCANGPVRVARWTPSAPLPPGRYLADVNPEHVLGVTDLAGNAPRDLEPVFGVTG